MSLTTQSYMGRALRCIVKEGLWGRVQNIRHNLCIFNVDKYYL